MNNTMIKREYIMENIVWCLILFIWCKKLFFRCVSTFTYMQSLCILIFILVFVIGMGICSTWKWARNYVSLMQNIVIAWCLFVFLAYYDAYGKHFCVIAGITLTISCLMTVVIMIRKIKRPNKRKQIIKSRIRKSILCVRRNLFIAALIVLIPLGSSILLNGTFLNSEVEVTATYGDEHCLDANIEIISKIYPERWGKLSVQEKLDVCQAIVNCEARYLGLSHEISVGVEELAKGTLGYYSEAKHLVVINVNHLKKSYSYDILKTLIHEVTHAYQFEQVYAYRKADEKTRNLLLFYDASIYNQELSDYKQSDDNYWEYYGQKIEADARRTAERESKEYIERVNEYIPFYRFT